MKSICHLDPINLPAKPLMVFFTQQSVVQSGGVCHGCSTDHHSPLPPRPFQEPPDLLSSDCFPPLVHPPSSAHTSPRPPSCHIQEQAARGCTLEIHSCSRKPLYSYSYLYCLSGYSFYWERRINQYCHKRARHLLPFARGHCWLPRQPLCT